MDPQARRHAYTHKYAFIFTRDAILSIINVMHLCPFLSKLLFLCSRAVKPSLQRLASSASGEAQVYAGTEHTSPARSRYDFTPSITLPLVWLYS